MAAGTYSFKGTADMSQHNEQIKKAKKEVNEYKKEVENAQKETNKLSQPNFSKAFNEQKKMTNMVKGTEKALGGLTKGFGGMIGKAGIWGAAFAAIFKGAKAHMEAMSKVSDSAGDKMKETAASVKGAWDEFIWATANNQGWDNLFERMDFAATKARQLAKLMDSALTKEKIDDVEILRIQNQIQQQRNIADQAKIDKKKTTDKGEQERLAKVITDAEHQVEVLTAQLRKLYESRQKDANDVAMGILESAGFDRRNGSAYAHQTHSTVGRAYISAMGGNSDLQTLAMNMNRPSGDEYATDLQRHWNQLFDYLDKVTKYSGDGKSDRWYLWSGSELTGDKGVNYLPLINQELKALGLQTIGKKSDGLTADLPVSQMEELDETRRWRHEVLDKLQSDKLWDPYTDELKKAAAAEGAALSAESQLLQMQRKDLPYTYGNGGGGGGNTKPKGPDWQVGSIAEIDDMIKKLQDRLKNEKFDLNTQIDINQQIEELENQKAMLELQVAIGGNTDLTSAFGGLLDGVLQAGTVDDFCSNMVDLIDNYFASQPEFQLPAVVFPSAEMEESAREAMKNMEQIIEEEYIKICEEIRQQNEEMADSFDSLGTIFSSIGSTMEGAAGDMMSAFGNILGTIGTVIAKIVALAEANGVASAMELPWPANLAAVATVISGLMPAIAMIDSVASKKYAGGGIFDGSGPKIGDMHIARVNPGEMILNDRQQANLFRLLNGNAIMDNNMGGGNGHVEFHIKGTDLVGVLNNNNKQRRRVT